MHSAIYEIYSGVHGSYEVYIYDIYFDFYCKYRSFECLPFPIFVLDWVLGIFQLTGQ